jgi:hypothetical protein
VLEVAANCRRTVCKCPCHCNCWGIVSGSWIARSLIPNSKTNRCVTISGASWTCILLQFPPKSLPHQRHFLGDQLQSNTVSCSRSGIFSAKTTGMTRPRHRSGFLPSRASDPTCKCCTSRMRGKLQVPQLDCRIVHLTARHLL